MIVKLTLFKVHFIKFCSLFTMFLLKKIIKDCKTYFIKVCLRGMSTKITTYVVPERPAELVVVHVGL